MTALLVALAGGVGAATRFVVDGHVRSRSGGPFPFATFVVNVTGSLLLGLLTGAVAFHDLAADAYAVAAVGFCGGYTTFSTAMVETVRLVQEGEVRRAVLNALGSLAATLAAAAAGVALMAALA
ncbi:fluoride efflux transporter CrcB [Actinotalea solisilvae]|uniref:fluoride efflux transporter CrcB n=1 Tax=Actinotalea solisilvae TaxID=2072922 RepID=UPI0018F256E5|nr:fluoride efflux transporter CrcB [Actinotalea solisilvae]